MMLCSVPRPEFIVERHGNSSCGVVGSQLHDSMTSMLANCDKSLHFENLAGFRAREDSQLTQLAPQLE